MNHQTGKAVPAQVRLTDLGVPPGFVVPPEAFEAAVADGTTGKHTGAAPQIIVCPEALANKDALVPLSRPREPFRRAPAYSPYGHPQTSQS